MRGNLFLIFLFLTVAIIFERGVRSISLEYDRLETYKTEIALQKVEALRKKENLERQIMSQSDPNWITLTLIRVLGVVPEGQTKVYFKKK